MASRRGTMELRYLVALAAVGRTGSFSGAAEFLGYTQSAISQHIARLERICGHKLVERPGGSKAVSLTPAGRILLKHADAITARLDSARADLDALSQGTAGLLRVGCFQSVGVRILPRVLSQFAARWPQVTVELVEAEDDAELLAQVEGGALDLAFVVYPMMPGPFSAVELMTDPYVVVVRDDHELAAESGPIHPGELAGVPLITYAQMREVHSIVNRLGRPEFTDQIIFRSNHNGTIVGLAAEGVGVAVISWLSVDPLRPGVRTRALAGISPRVVGIAWHRDRYRIPAHEAFVELAQRELAKEHAVLTTTLGALPAIGSAPGN